MRTATCPPDATIRVRLCTVAEKDEPLSYKVMARSGWKKIFGFADAGQETVVWNCPKERTADGLFTFDVSMGDVTDGVLGIQLRTSQKQVLHDWHADGGFIARLERIVVTAAEPKPRAAAAAWTGGADGIYLFNECYMEPSGPVTSGAFALKRRASRLLPYRPPAAFR